jgi:hypothetical protein
MTPTCWGPEKGRFAIEETEMEWARELKRGRCTAMWVSPHVCLLHVIWLTVTHIKMFLYISVVGWDGVVSIAGWVGVVSIVACCGLVSLGIESWWGQDFLHSSTLALAPPTSFTVGIRSLSPGVKWPGHSIDHPPLSSAKVKGRVELYLFSSSGPSWPVLSLTCLFTYFFLKWRCVYYCFNMWTPRMLYMYIVTFWLAGQAPYLYTVICQCGPGLQVRKSQYMGVAFGGLQVEEVMYMWGVPTRAQDLKCTPLLFC